MIQLIQSIINAIAVPVRQLYIWFCNCLPGANYLSNLSLPWKWALITLASLVSLWVGVGVNHHYTTNKMPFSLWLWILIGSAALFIIPFLVYHFVRYWIMKEESRYPDIDRIWFEGLDVIDQNGIWIGGTPIYLVLGTSNVRESNNLIQIAGFQPSGQSPATGEGPISFYANNDAIIVFLHGCSCLSRLSKSPSRAIVTSADAETNQLPDNGGTIDSTYFAKLRTASLNQPSETMSGTLFASGEFSKELNHSGEISGGTILVGEGDFNSYVGSSVPSSRQLNSNEYEDCDARMRHVCQLLQSARGSICPMNGLLTIIPFELIESSPGALQLAMQRDSATLRELLRVRVPNTVLLTGFEQDEGFIELMKRIPKAQVANNRFGKGADLWCHPSSDRLSAIATHALAQFEDWIYDLFKSEESLKQKYNSRLFKLLCRMRSVFAENLVTVLSSGLGVGKRADAREAESQFLFGGCYFAATGLGKSEQGFAANVFKKLLDQPGEIEWTPDALEEDRRYQFMANIALLIGLLSILAILGMLISKFLIKQ